MRFPTVILWSVAIICTLIAIVDPSGANTMRAGVIASLLCFDRAITLAIRNASAKKENDHQEGKETKSNEGRGREKSETKS